MGTIREDQRGIEHYLENSINPNKRIAIIGVGNEDRHDDFVGAYILRALEQKGLKRENLLLIDAGTGPSNYIADIATWNADYVLMIDAVDAQEEPGRVLVIQKDQLHSQSVDSHSNAKVLLLEFLMGLNPSLGVVIVGIQVADISLEHALTKEVQQSADWLVEVLYRLFMV